ncbi:MAG: hypothetical protein JW763_10930 [candidate division Zixibacteria bacterium]|nr:hypothetical protein [candidate division Zixibacteria bacterium]
MQLSSRSLLIYGAILFLLCFSGAMAVEKPDFMVNEEDYQAIFPQIGVSMDGNAAGNFVICWHDERESEPYAYFQLYGPDGLPIGTNQRVDDVPLYTQTHSYPRVVMKDDGQFVIMYVAHIPGHTMYQAAMRFFDAAGNPIGDRLVVTSVGVDHRNVTNFDLAMNNLGHIVAVFDAYIVGGYDEYLQYVEFPGTLVGENVLIPYDGFEYLADVTVAINDDDQVMMLSRSGYGDGIPCMTAGSFAFGATLPSAGTMLDTGVASAPDTVYFHFNYPDVVVQDDGIFCAFWATSEQYTFGVWEYNHYAHIFTADGNPLGDRLTLFENLGDSLSVLTGPAISAAADDFIVCRDHRLDDTFVYQRIATDGATVGPCLRTASNADFPLGMYMDMYVSPADRVILSANSGTTTAAYKNDVYYHVYDSDGSEVLATRMVNDDIGADQCFPVMAFDPDGYALALWIDKRQSVNGDLYGQVYDPNGNPVGANFKVNIYDNPGNGYCDHLSLQGNANGRAVAVWTGNGVNFKAVRAAVFDYPYFTQYGTCLNVHDPTHNFYSFQPDVGVDQDGNFVVTWRDRVSQYEYVYNAYARAYWANVTVRTAEIQINDTEGDEIPYGGESLVFNYVPRIAMQPSGRFGVAWIDEYDHFVLPADYHIRLRRFNGAIVPVDTSIVMSPELSVASGANEEIPPSIAVNHYGDFAVAWTGSRNYAGIHYDGIWAQIADKDGNLRGNALQITDHTLFQYFPPARIIAGTEGIFMGVWFTIGYDDPQIQTQKFNRDGLKCGLPTRIDNDELGYRQSYPTAAYCTNTLGFIWEDFRNGLGNPDIFACFTDWIIQGDVYGDVNIDGEANLLDILFLISYLYDTPPGPAPDPFELGDINVDGYVNLLDILTLIDFVYG